MIVVTFRQTKLPPKNNFQNKLNMRGIKTMILSKIKSKIKLCYMDIDRFVYEIK